MTRALGLALSYCRPASRRPAGLRANRQRREGLAVARRDPPSRRWRRRARGEARRRGSSGVGRAERRRRASRRTSRQPARRRADRGWPPTSPQSSAPDGSRSPSRPTPVITSSPGEGSVMPTPRARRQATVDPVPPAARMPREPRLALTQGTQDQGPMPDALVRGDRHASRQRPLRGVHDQRRHGVGGLKYRDASVKRARSDVLSTANLQDTSLPLLPTCRFCSFAPSSSGARIFCQLSMR